MKIELPYNQYITCEIKWDESGHFYLLQLAAERRRDAHRDPPACMRGTEWLRNDMSIRETPPAKALPRHTADERSLRDGVRSISGRW